MNFNFNLNFGGCDTAKYESDIRLERAKILLRIVAKIYIRLYVVGWDGESKFVPGPHHTNVCKISRL